MEILILAISDTVWLAAIPAICTLISTLALAIIQRQTREAVVEGAKRASLERADVKKTARVAADRVEEVRQTLSKESENTIIKLDELQEGSKQIHTLVNANMGAQLKISSIALRRLADLTKHPEDMAAAELADKRLLEHEAKQKDVNSQNPQNV
jgi:hypothetical protein